MTALKKKIKKAHKNNFYFSFISLKLMEENVMKQKRIDSQKQNFTFEFQ
jgi:hypothetical protein